MEPTPLLITLELRNGIANDPATPAPMPAALDHLEQLVRYLMAGAPVSAYMHTETFIHDHVMASAVLALAVTLIAASEKRLTEAAGTFEGLDQDTQETLINQVATNLGIDPEEVKGKVKDFFQ
jgi:hypothetical protein